MNTLKIITIVIAGFCVVFGFFSLIAAWFAPKLLTTPLMRWMTTGHRLTPSRSNQALMAIWSMLFGTYIVLAITGHTIISLAVFVVWLPFCFTVLKRTFSRTHRA